MTAPASSAGGLSAARAIVGAGAAGFGVMAAELTAVRLLAPHFGDSAYVWTNVIGVILAAMALGACACDGTQRSNLALSSVTRTYRRRRCDPRTGKPKPTDLADFAAAIVDEGLVTALGLPRAPPESTSGWEDADDAWITPTECVDLLVDALNHTESDGDPHDSSSLIATAIHALGRARPATLDGVRRITRAIAGRMRENATICGVGGRAHEGGRRAVV